MKCANCRKKVIVKVKSQYEIVEFYTYFCRKCSFEEIIFLNNLYQKNNESNKNKN